MPLDRIVTRGAVEPLHLVPGVLDLAEHGPNLAGGQDSFESSHIRPFQVRQDRLLGEVAEIAAAQNGAGGRCGVSDQGSNEGGLTRPVPPDQPDFVPGLHAEGRPLEEEAGAEFDPEVSDYEHG